MDADARLRTLSTLHYAYGAIVCLVGLVLLGLVFLGHFLESDWMASHATDDIPPWTGPFVRALGWGLFLLVEAKGALNLLVGGWLARGVHRTGCMVVAAIDLLNMPIGLMLGVFTLVSLNDARVAARFGVRA